jgi:lipopolysaccharide export system protein LptA
VTDNPHWQARRMEGRGDELLIDRTNGIFQANGQAWFKMPGRGGGATGFFPPPSPGPAPAVESTNSFVEIFSRNYEVRTNQAVFIDRVNAKEYTGQQTPNTMTCEVMTAFFSSTNEVRKVVAERDVVIEQADKSFQAAKAVYTATNGLLELTGSPFWRAGEREGRGDLIRVLATNEEMRVEGNATVRLPAHELGQAVPAVTPSRPGRRQSSREQFAEISSRRYTLWPKSGLFQGRVIARHPQVTWACETMTVETPATNRVIVTAEQAVTFDLVDEQGQPVHGVGDKAVYNYSLVGNVTNEVLTLTGHPAALKRGTNNASLLNDTINYDRANNKVTALGAFTSQGTAPAAGSNSLRIPINPLNK